MQFALLIYESPEAFAARKSAESDSYTGAWRAYHKAIVESGDVHCDIEGATDGGVEGHPGPFIAVSGGGGTGCAVRSDGS